MRRTTDAYRDPDLFGTSRAGFTDGVPNVTAPTIMHAADANSYQEELAGVVELVGGGVLDASSYHQVSAAINLARVRDACSNLTKLTLGSTTPTVRGFASVDRIHLVTGYGNRVVYCSTGGSTFERTVNLTDTSAFGTAVSLGSSYTGTLNTACFGLGRYVVGGASGEIQTAAPTGSLSWTRRKNGGADIRDIRVGVPTTGSTWMLALDAGGHIWRTTNPESTWSDAGALVPNTATGIAYSAPLAMWACAAGTAVYTSADNGASWTERTLGGGGVALSVAWCSGTSRWIASGYASSGMIARAWASVDGVTWTNAFTRSASSGSGNCMITMLSACPGGVVGLYLDHITSTVVASSDGVTWRRVANLPDNSVVTALNWCSIGAAYEQLHVGVNETSISGTAGNVYVSRRVNTLGAL